MKKLNSSLFKKFEANKINNLAKFVGGALGNTNWQSGQSGGYDVVNSDTDDDNAIWVVDPNLGRCRKMDLISQTHINGPWPLQ
jgi:hypothetical protein